MIPHVTHQIWFQGWHELPEKYHEYTEKLAILNQNWEHMKWDELGLRAECAVFSPEAVAKFDSFPRMIQKVDFLGGTSCSTTMEGFPSTVTLSVSVRSTRFLT
jgi:mannosyltransferase OCH1-like enzyme